jgi:hypothetical protein
MMYIALYKKSLQNYVNIMFCNCVTYAGFAWDDETSHSHEFTVFFGDSCVNLIFSLR